MSDETARDVKPNPKGSDDVPCRECGKPTRVSYAQLWAVDGTAVVHHACSKVVDP